MRALFWLLTLFALATLLALFAGNNQAVITLYWSPQQAIDLSLNLVLLVLALVALLAYVLVRSVSGLLQLPRQARRWRIQQKERAMHGQLLDAMSHFLAGRFTRARKAAEQVLKQDESLYGSMGATSETRDRPATQMQADSTSQEAVPYRMQLRTLAHFLLAESSQSLQDVPARDAHYAQALQTAQQIRAGAAAETREGIQLRAARWAIEERNPALALQRLDALPQGAARRIQALRHRLKAARLLDKTDMALDTARALARHKAFSANAGAVLVSRLLIGHIQSAEDAAQLQQIWKSMDRQERASPEVALHAAQRLASLNGDPRMVRDWLLPVWQDYAQHHGQLAPEQQAHLVRVLETGMDSMDDVWLGQIETAYQRQPNQPVLQYLMGMTCLKRQLWGKAQQLLTQFTKNRLAETGLQRNAWRALAMLAEQRGDTADAHHAWKQAALLAS